MSCFGKAEKIYKIYKKYRKVYNKWLSLKEDSLFVDVKDDYEQDQHTINCYLLERKKEKLEKKLSNMLEGVK